MTNHPLHILIAPSSFKESLTSQAAAEAIAAGFQASQLACQITLNPLADGGTGTVDILVKASGGEFCTALVTDPLGQPILAHYGLLESRSIAIIEMAAASGLALVPPAQRNPMITSSYGTGLLIKDALAQKVSQIIVGVGDSATVDGGVGALQALGLKVFDSQGYELPPQGGATLLAADHIDSTELDPRLANVEILIAADVDNPLLGTTGAAQVFGPQKGADLAMVQRLEVGLTNWADILTAHTSRDLRLLKGTGAAGGFALGFMTLFPTRLISGTQLIFDYSKIESKLSDADIIITGEGAIDQQTLRGKAPGQLVALAKAYNKPVIVFIAQNRLVESQEIEAEMTIIPIIDQVMSLAEAQKQGSKLLQQAAQRTAKLLLLGHSLNSWR